jgi:ABC-type amino acid transport substrate-binding protein
MALVLLMVLLALAACGQGGGTAGTTATQAPPAGGAATSAPAAQPTSAPAETSAPAAQPTAAAEKPTEAAATGGGDLLAEVKKRGTLLISTDSNYKPQSFKNPDGSWEGFDIDVGKEIAKRRDRQAARRRGRVPGHQL